MIVRKCTQADVDRLAALMAEKNSRPEHRCAYCRTDRRAIEEDLMECLRSDSDLAVGCFGDDGPVGVVSFCVDREKKTADCIGPFVASEPFVPLSIAMLDAAGPMLGRTFTYKFFFDSRNTGCIALMEALSAQNHGNELVLSLRREKYTGRNNGIRVHPLPRSHFDHLAALHDSLFPGIYVSGKDILSSLGHDRQALCIPDGDVLAGYGILRRTGGARSANAEILGVAPGYRRRGYGGALLDAMTAAAFGEEAVDRVFLVVEKANKDACRLYFRAGFELDAENCYYYTIR